MAEEPQDKTEATEADLPAEAKPETEATPKPAAKPKRRASAETGARKAPASRAKKTPVKQSASAPAAKAETAAGEALVVHASARYVKHAPRKARLVVDNIRGKSVADARAILTHTPRAASVEVLKLLNSCVANAENNHELDPDTLFVDKIFVDDGPTLKRWQPRARGRASQIRKRTCHMTVALTTKQERR